ncbi:MAG: aspartate--tRNA ligase [Clostridiales bacterium]|jgi:aspartyl-tRNA synthetase|nr:aspartate--tRNA ligase [Clostridiales bacterium]
MYRTHTCGELRKAHVKKPATLAGWVDTIRDHGGVVFVDLRDHYGITQVVFYDDDILKEAGKESVISVEGVVRERDNETVNKRIPTGEVELKAEKFKILGIAERNLPFEISESRQTNESVRLKYRFLDLRNPLVQKDIVLRSKVTSFIRKKMEEMGFIEIQTPILTSSSPEGARDYLVPSRKHKGMFYALPQAPQIFKQLLMTSGFDKYFQIAPCFRDEDARADRSPGEFYQVDFEMAFATQDDVFETAEKLLYDTFSTFSKKKISKPPFKRVPYSEAMLKYGSDKPDLRNPLIIEDLSDFFTDVDFAPFKNKPVRGIVAPDCIKMPKSFFENMLEYATSIGMKGLGYISVSEGFEYKGPIVKFLTEQKQKDLAKRLNLKQNDVLFFISDKAGAVDGLAGQIRAELGKRLNLIDTSAHEFCFVTDFPMYGVNEESGNVEFMHNPFSMPQGEMQALLSKNPLDIKAYQYDIVCDGVELSSGAVRNHKPDVMVKAFEIAGYPKEVIEEKFSALYNAFKYGAPPHAGMAPGLDRIVMLLTGNESIREVVAFPMNSNAQDLLLGAPGSVTERQLRDVHIKVR